MKILMNSFFMLCVVYILGVFVFSGYMGFRTYVNDESVFMLAKEEVLINLQQDVAHRTIQLVRRDGTSEYITYGQMGVVFENPLHIDMLHTNAWLWFVNMFKRMDYAIDTSVSVSDSVLLQNVSQLECMSSSYMRGVTNSSVSLLSDGTYQVIADDCGNEIDIEHFVLVLKDAILNGRDVVDLEDAGVYMCEVMCNRDDDVVSHKSVDDLISCNLSLDLGANTVISVPKEVIKASVYEIGGITYIHYPILYAYSVHLADTYNTVGLNRVFRTSDGGNLMLKPSDGDTFYGWELNKTKTVTLLCDALAAGDDVVVEALWITQGKSHMGLNDIGDTYVELSIEQQHMWCYVDGDLLFDTDVTTGTHSIVHQRTPVGMFMTMDWNRNYTMRGSYGTAFARYFIRLTPLGVGIHDSSWRSKYGGTEYLENGSHGCINTPYKYVKLFYDTLYLDKGVGIPVVIY